MATKENDFYALVKEMRLAQREYFACRCPSSLNRAKKLEKEVDRKLKAREEANNPRQSTLFKKNRK